MSQSQDTVEHTIKLKSTSPYVSALVLSIDFWRITQWPTTTKASPLPSGNAAYVSKPKQSTGILLDLFHWRFCIHKSKFAWTIVRNNLLFYNQKQQSRCISFVTSADLSWHEINLAFIISIRFQIDSHTYSDIDICLNENRLGCLWKSHYDTSAVGAYRKNLPNKSESNIVHTLETLERD